MEKYISGHRDGFDVVLPPDGSHGRFAEKLGQYTAVKRRRAIMTYAAVVAAVIISGAVFMEEDTAHLLRRQSEALAKSEAEIMIIVENNYPHEKELAADMIRVIIKDAVPLEEQLPEFLPPKMRNRILKENYDNKAQALLRIKEMYVQNIDK